MVQKRSLVVTALLTMVADLAKAQESDAPSDVPSDAPSIVPALSAVPTVAASTFPVCPLCPEGERVKEKDTEVAFGGSNYMCALLEEGALEGVYDPTECADLQFIVPNSCGCAVPSPSLAPSAGDPPVGGSSLGTSSSMAVDLFAAGATAFVLALV